LVWAGRGPSDLCAKVSFFPPGKPGFLCAATNAGHVFSCASCSVRGHTASQWLDLAEGRLRLDRLSRNGGGATFFPWPPAIPRGSQESPAAAILRCAPARGAGASSIASGLQIAIEAAVVAGLKQPRRSEMANIGSFKKSGSEFQGEIVTLSVQTKNVRIVPEANRANDNAPSHRVFVGRAEIGAAWSKRSNEGRDYLSVKLDDPSFNAPIYANLFDGEDGDGFTLIWSRARRPNGD
jgi:uncharacterized protein (DUF736 family)